MKKVLSLVLALSLVLSTFTLAPAFAASSNMDDIKGEACESAVNVLVDLGVVTGYEDGTYKPENIVTRAEMAVLVVNALGLQSYVTDTAKSSFTDMANYGWAEGYIAYAQSLGVISGYGDGTFKPGNTVSYDEAATMLVAALGYTTDSLQGTWPANFVTKAKSLGILDGIKAGAAGANRGDVAIMMYQTLDQEIGVVNKDGEWKSNKTDASIDTMLDRLGASVYKPTAANEVPSADKEAFVLTETDANDAVVNVRPYIGAVVSAYVNDDDEIIAIKEVFSTFITGTYSDKDKKFTLNNDTEYDYTGSEEAKAYFYNGETSNAHDSTLKMSEVDGDREYTLAVDLSGKKIKDVYTIMYWDITDDAKVDADDIAEIKDDHKLLGVEFEEDDNDDIDLTSFELYGVDSLDDIKADNIVYVYKNDSDKIARVAVGPQTVSGQITKVNGDKDTVTLDGKKYNYASLELAKNGGNNGDACANDLKASDEVTLYLDAYGYIYDYSKTSGSADKYAIVLKTGKTAGVSSDLQIKLFTADGSTKTFDVDTDDIENIVDINGDNIFTTSSGVNWSTDWNETKAAGMLIKYGVNKDGEIDSIEASRADDFKPAAANKSVTSKGYYDGKEIKTDAVIFSYDGKADDSEALKSDDGNYTASKLSSVLDSDSIPAGVYCLDSNKIEAALLIGFSASDDIYGVLTEWGEGTDDTYEYVMFVDGSDKTYTATKEGKNYMTNDLYELNFNSAGEVKGLTKVNTTTAGLASAEDTGIMYKIDSVGSPSAIQITSYDGTTTFGAMSNGNISSVSGSKLTIGNGGADHVYTLDSNVAVYLVDDGDWTYEKKSVLGDLKAKDSLYLYNVGSDDEEVVTVAIIVRP